MWKWLKNIVKIEGPSNPPSTLWGFYLSSGEEDNPGTKLYLMGFGRFVTVKLPNFIPHYKKYRPADNYTVIYPRNYGITYLDNHVSIRYGRQTHDSSSDMSKGFFIPWNETRHIRCSLFDGYHRPIKTFHDKDAPKGLDKYHAQWEAQGAIPRRVFRFKDFDGEEIDAHIYIEEREWRRGTGWFKWLSLFCEPTIRRSIQIEFSSEVGPKKGSWKGGTTGHSAEMGWASDNIDVGECEYEDAMFTFHKYCSEHNLTYLCEIHGGICSAEDSHETFETLLN